MRRYVSDLLRDGGVVVYTAPHTPVLEAAKKMSEHNVGSILVLDDARHLVGIFTERDLLRRVVLEGLDAASTPVRQVMSADVYTVPPEAPRQEVLQLMNERHIRHVPVLRDGTVIGVISLRDILRFENLEKDFEIEQLRQYVHQPPNSPPYVS